MRDQVVEVIDRLGMLRAALRVYEALRSLRPFPRPRTSDGLPLPSRRLRVRVAGTADPAWFIESGRATALALVEAWSRQRLVLDGGARMLDFGCGCGRVTRHLVSLVAAKVHGCDPDTEAVRWCARHLGGAHFATQPAAPPLAYADRSFDAICAISIFTHLPENDQHVWLAELYRVLAPAGVLILTTHGERYRGRLVASEREAFDAGRLVVRRPAAAGTNLCTAFHAERYVREVLARSFELVELLPGGAAGVPDQDLIVLQRPDRAG